MTFALRPYQDDSLARVGAEWRSGGKRVVLVLPTGAGKTITAGAGVARAVARGRRVLWLAHRTELIEQTAKALHRMGLPIGVLAASSAWPTDPTAPVQVASVQTLLARPACRPPADLLVWDECHHVSESAPAWAALLAAYPDVRTLGLTATPERGDGTGLAPVFDRLVVGVTVRDLVAMNAADHRVGLVPCEVSRPDTLLASNQLAREPLEAYQADSPGEQGFLFAKSVDEAQRYAVEFSAAGIRAECIHAGTKPEDRAVLLELFRQGIVRILSNVYIFTEGTDLPQASVCILARGASTAGIYLQMVGRVLRPCRGKRRAMIIDLRGVSWVHLMPEDERHYSLTGKAIAVSEIAKCKVCSQALGNGGYPCTSCGYAPEAGDDGSTESEIVNAPMQKYARMLAQSPQQRFETLVRWLCAADVKGHKRTSIRYKWRHVYGDAPSREAWDRACLEADRMRAAA